MAKEVQILKPNITRVVITVEGLTPLLQNRFSEDSVEQIKAKQAKAAKVGKEARDPEHEFANSMHVVESANGTPGIYGHPSTGFKTALGSAWTRFGGERSAKGLKGALSIEKPLVPIEGPPPEMAEDPVKIPRGPWTVAYRAKFWPWRVKLPITFDENFISTEQLVNLMITAGFSVGVGAWRPENGGDHGQFRVTDVQEVASR